MTDHKCEACGTPTDLHVMVSNEAGDRIVRVCADHIDRYL